MQRKNELISERDDGRRRVQIDCSAGGRTEQSHRDTCNINTIMAKAIRQGGLPLTERINRARFGDFSQTGSFHEMQNMVKKAEQDFAALPSGIRKEFDNDPGKLIDFLNDAENREKAEELGLVVKTIPETPVVTEPVTPVEPAPTE